MVCYKDFSSSGDALFVIGDGRFLPSLLAAALISHLFSNRRNIMAVKSF